MGSRFSKARRGVEAAAAFGEKNDKKEAKSTENDKGVVNNNTDEKQEDSGKETTKDHVNDNKEPEIKQSILEDDINKKSTSGSVIEPDQIIKEELVVQEDPKLDTTLEEKIDKKVAEDTVSDKDSGDNNRDIGKDGTKIDAIDKTEPEKKQSLLDFEETSTNESTLAKEEALMMSEDPDLIGKELISTTKDNTSAEDLISTGPDLTDSNMLGENNSESAKSFEAPLTPNNDKTADIEISIENKKKEPTNLEHDLSEFIQEKGNLSSPSSTKGEEKNLEQTEAEDKMDSVTVEVEQETDILNPLEETNKQETLNDANVLIDTRSLDLVSNTDLFTGDNSQLIENTDNHIMEIENDDGFKVLEEKIVEDHDEIAQEKVDDLLSLDKGEKKDDNLGSEVVHTENLEKQMRTNEESSASLLNFGEEEPKTGNEKSSTSLLDFGAEESNPGGNDTTVIAKKDVVDIATLDFEPTGIESINSQDLQFLETVKAQNVTKSEDPEVENLLNF